MSPETILILFFGLISNKISDENMKTVFDSHGSPFEEHEIVTDDGYLLTAFRIPNVGGPPILIQHGLFGSSVDWIINGPKKAFAYLAWEAGFDVWIGNNRGNFYSTKHQTLNITSKEYWNFSWHEMGIYDIPAEIDYILKLTQFQRVFYVGYSQGGTAYPIMTTERPEYNNKIQLATLIAPPIEWNFSKSNLTKELLYFLSQNMDIIEEFQLYQMFPKGGFLQRILQFQSTIKSPILKLLTIYFLNLIGGPDSGESDYHILQQISAHYPSGGSLKQVIHYSQLIAEKDGFRNFNYGPDINMMRYNSSRPPLYNISRSIAPVYVVYSTNDYLVDHGDTENFIKNLPSVVLQMRLKKFNHFNFISGIHASEFIYKPILNNLKKYVTGR